MMRHIVEETEKDATECFLHEKDDYRSTSVAVAKSAKYIASQVGAKVIVAGTARGFTALAVSHYRPETPIVAVTSDERVARACAIVWGVVPVTLHGPKSVDGFLKMTITHLKRQKHIVAGDHIVFISGAKLGESGKTNHISVVKAS